MPQRKLVFAIALALTFATREAAGEPVIYKLKSPSTLTTEKGSTLKLPPGYFLDEPTWLERDLEMRRLQEQETRLRAENRSLRKSAVDDYPWLATGMVGAFGVALGVFVMMTK